MSKELTQNMGQFDELLSIIDSARTRALKAVNAEADPDVLECGGIPFRSVRQLRFR